ncbi:MAG: hypothetical protein Q4E06_08475 [Lautropia sp.]|nr:hypothetical protein [Lautropia sp.]
MKGFCKSRVWGLLLVVGLAGCGSDGGHKDGDVLRAYRPAGTVQCQDSPPSIDLQALARPIVEAGFEVKGMACGVDGRAHLAVCGAPDGRIGIFDLKVPDAGQAATRLRAMGYALPEDLPDARTAECR